MDNYLNFHQKKAVTLLLREYQGVAEGIYLNLLCKKKSIQCYTLTVFIKNRCK